MNSGRNLDHVPGISLVDIYFVLFRRKWLILFFAVLGLVAGGGYYATKQPLYQSSALLSTCCNDARERALSRLRTWIDPVEASEKYALRIKPLNFG